jgi:phage terminase large subunit-like protein
MNLLPQKIHPIGKYPILTTIKGKDFTVTAAEAKARKANNEDEYETFQMGRPLNKESQLFRPDFFIIDGGIDYDRIVAPFMAVDTSTGMSKDPTAIVSGLLMVDNVILITDAIEEKIDFGEQEQFIPEVYFELYSRFKRQPLLFLEKASTGDALYNKIKQDNRIAVELKPAHKSKVMRGREIKGTCMSHRVHLYRHMPMLGKLLSDLSNFPFDAKNDHIPDAFCLLVSNMNKLHEPVKNVQHLLVDANRVSRAQEISNALDEIEYEEFTKQWDWMDF